MDRNGAGYGKGNGNGYGMDTRTRTTDGNRTDADGQRKETAMARNMHGVDQDNATVKEIAAQSGAHPGFVVAMIEYYSDGEGWEMDGHVTSVDKAIVQNAMVGALAYDEQDDDDDNEQTAMMRRWVLRKARNGFDAGL